jgi:hypothetical protein
MPFTSKTTGELPIRFYHLKTSKSNFEQMTSRNAPGYNIQPVRNLSAQARIVTRIKVPDPQTSFHRQSRMDQLAQNAVEYSG